MMRHREKERGSVETEGVREALHQPEDDIPQNSSRRLTLNQDGPNLRLAAEPCLGHAGVPATIQQSRAVGEIPPSSASSCWFVQARLKKRNSTRLPGRRLFTLPQSQHLPDAVFAGGRLSNNKWDPKLTHPYPELDPPLDVGVPLVGLQQGFGPRGQAPDPYAAYRARRACYTFARDRGQAYVSGRSREDPPPYGFLFTRTLMGLDRQVLGFEFKVRVLLSPGATFLPACQALTRTTRTLTQPPRRRNYRCWWQRT